MSRGSSQSWRGRAARPGPVTRRRRAGVTTRGVGDPGGPRPSRGRPAAPCLGTEGAAHGQRRRGAGGAALRGVGVSALSWGRGAPSRAGEGAGSRVRPLSRLRPDHTPGTLSYFRASPGPQRPAWPHSRFGREAQESDPSGRLRVGGAGCAARDPSGPRSGSSSRAAACRPGRPRGGGPSGPGEAQERVDWRGSSRDRRAHRGPLAGTRSAPCLAFRAGKGARSRSPSPGMGRASSPAAAWTVSSPPPVRDSRLPKVAGAGARDKTPESGQPISEVARNRKGGSLRTRGLAQAGPTLGRLQHLGELPAPGPSGLCRLIPLQRFFLRERPSRGPLGSDAPHCAQDRGL